MSAILILMAVCKKFLCYLGDLVLLLHVLPLILMLAEKFLFFYAKLVLLLLLDLEGVFYLTQPPLRPCPFFFLDPDGEDEVVV